jgi:hypothetical protein
MGWFGKRTCAFFVLSHRSFVLELDRLMGQRPIGFNNSWAGLGYEHCVLMDGWHESEMMELGFLDRIG